MWFREAFIPIMAVASYKWGKNVQLFSSCLYVGLRYSTTGQPPLCAGLEEGRLGSSGQLCHLERGHQLHVSSLAMAIPRGEAAPVSDCGSTWFFSSAGKGLKSEQRQHPVCVQCCCMQEYEPVQAWVMGKISCLPPFLLCGAAIQSLRLRRPN